MSEGAKPATGEKNHLGVLHKDKIINIFTEKKSSKAILCNVMSHMMYDEPESVKYQLFNTMIKGERGEEELDLPLDLKEQIGVS